MTVTTTPSPHARTLVDDLLRRGVVQAQPTLFAPTAQPLDLFRPDADVDSVTRNGQLAPALQRDVQGFLKDNPDHPFANASPAEVSRQVAAELERRGTPTTRFVRGSLGDREFAGEPEETQWDLGKIMANIGDLVTNTMDDLEAIAKRGQRPDRPRFVKPIPHELTDISEFAVADAEGAPAADGQRYHAGKDWFAPGGTPVRSPIDGKIVEVSPSTGSSGQVFGGTVKVQGENGRVWAFRHVDPKDLEVGARVKAGDRLASVTEWQDGPSHAHVELWKTLEGGYTFENMIDPMTKLKRFQ